MKRLQNTYVLFLMFLFVGIVSFYSFDQRDDEERTVISDEPIPVLVQKELDKKLQRYQQIILDKCRTKAIEDAELYIDSLVAEELKFQASDTLKFPAKPRRPIMRDPIILNDTTAIAPIIK